MFFTREDRYAFEALRKDVDALFGDVGRLRKSLIADEFDLRGMEERMIKLEAALAKQTKTKKRKAK